MPQLSEETRPPQGQRIGQNHGLFPDEEVAIPKGDIRDIKWNLAQTHAELWMVWSQIHRATRSSLGADRVIEETNRMLFTDQITSISIQTLNSRSHSTKEKPTPELTWLPYGSHIAELTLTTENRILVTFSLKNWLELLLIGSLGETLLDAHWERSFWHQPVENVLEGTRIASLVHLQIQNHSLQHRCEWRCMNIRVTNFPMVWVTVPWRTPSQ